jgi:hypothetical protein
MTVSCYEPYKLCPSIIDVFKTIFIILLLNWSVMKVGRHNCPALCARETLDVSLSNRQMAVPLAFHWSSYICVNHPLSRHAPARAPCSSLAVNIPEYQKL